MGYAGKGVRGDGGDEIQIGFDINDRHFYEYKESTYPFYFSFMTASRLLKFRLKNYLLR